jgi:beta-glucanase (GH16 family)
VGGIVGGVAVLAAALVAVMSLNPPSGSTQAAGFTESTTGASATSSAAPSATAKAATAKASKTAKPTASAKPSKTAKPTTSASPTAATAAPSALAVPAGWKLAFDPSFSGSLDTGTWATCYTWAAPGSGCTNNPKIEKEWYLASQVSESGGTLNLTAQQEATPVTNSGGAPQTYSCRSGMVTSRPGFNFTYGLISITAKLPYGPGLWPALWLATTSGQWPPELDIMEHWYSDQDYRIYDHTVGTSYLGGPVSTPVDLSAGFHTFSLLWTKDRVTWYLDGVEKFTTTEDVPQQNMYFIANLADRNPDGDTSTSLVPGACNGTMEISSVKVWQP